MPSNNSASILWPCTELQTQTPPGTRAFPSSVDLRARANVDQSPNADQNAVSLDTDRGSCTKEPRELRRSDRHILRRCAWSGEMQQRALQRRQQLGEIHLLHRLLFFLHASSRRGKGDSSQHSRSLQMTCVTGVRAGSSLNACACATQRHAGPYFHPCALLWSSGQTSSR